MGDKPDLLSAQYETFKRKSGEDYASYILRFIQARKAQYSTEERLELAKLQMDLRDEAPPENLQITEEALIYLEALIAIYDYACTFEYMGDKEDNKYSKMLDEKRRLIEFLKPRLKRTGVIEQTALTNAEMLRETEQRVPRIAPIKDITDRLREGLEKFLKKS